jgi:heterodisulfide reductase subunit C2
MSDKTTDKTAREQMPLRIDPRGRKKLEKIIGADGISYCYQCGACVGDCLTARFYPDFNPREIIQTVIAGGMDSLLTSDSVIWKCSNCYNCYERCPQDVRPVEVIIALKNLAKEKDAQPADVQVVYEAIAKTGRSAPVLASLDKRRGKMGLPPLPKINLDEIAAILEPAEGEEKEKK